MINSKSFIMISVTQSQPVTPAVCVNTVKPREVSMKQARSTQGFLKLSRFSSHSSSGFIRMTMVDIACPPASNSSRLGEHTEITYWRELTLFRPILFGPGKK